MLFLDQILKSNFKFLFLIGIFLMPRMSIGQTYTINEANIYSNFTSGLIKDIVIDELGFVWIASDRGLIKFGSAR